MVFEQLNCTQFLKADNVLSGYNTVKRLDIIFLSESSLESSILTGNNNVKINGYKMVSDDHPNNVK